MKRALAVLLLFSCGHHHPQLAPSASASASDPDPVPAPVPDPDPDPVTPPSPDPAPVPDPAPAPPPAAPVPGTLEDPTAGKSLVPLFTALRAAEAGTDATAGRVAIVEFGDSHTAGDVLTGRLRRVLQKRFGDAGRGFVLAGRPPIKHYYLRDVSYGSDGKWFAERGGSKKSVEPFGLGGVRVHAERKDAVAWVSTCADCSAGHDVSRFEIFYGRSVLGGKFTYRVDDGAWKKVDTRAPADDDTIPGYEVVTVPKDGAHKLTMHPAGGGAVDFFGVALERDKPGVLVDALGIVGLQMSSLNNWDWNVIGPQLARRDPRLVILQYGTNEADNTDLKLDRLERQWTELVAKVKVAAPGATILILGPPDMGVRALGKACDPPKRRRGKGKKAKVTQPKVDPNAKPRAGCEWKTPASLLDIIAVERKVAWATGVLFFDSYTAMGGGDKMEGFFRADPPLAYKDRVHFTGKGYEMWGDLLLADLVAKYDAWLAAQIAAESASATKRKQ